MCVEDKPRVPAIRVKARVRAKIRAKRLGLRLGLLSGTNETILNVLWGEKG